MALTPGTRLGPYEVGAQIGAGGMGEVYRATDTSLKRSVAIKILPEALAGDPERLARFQREAEVLASLNHPNIAHIYGLEKSNTTTGLVMELVEGPTLADVIAGGHGTPEGESLRSSPRDKDGSVITRGGGAPRGLKIDDALPIAKQIAEALEAAHDQGIVHRDLKPANIKLTARGAPPPRAEDDRLERRLSAVDIADCTVKVLDFGLAKALQSGRPEGPPHAGSASMSPTLTTPAHTMQGVILGTATYMSPEQARGKAVDRRTDVWAFGCVLYEMLTGRRAFEDEDISMTLSKVLQRDPDFDALPAAVPTRIRQVLRLCLRKDRKARAGDMQSVRLALEGAFETTAPAEAGSTATPRRGLLIGAFAGLVVGAAVAGTAVWLAGARGAAPASVERLSVMAPANRPVAINGSPSRALALSPDGSELVYTSTILDLSAGQSRGRLALRSLATRDVRDLPGTDNAKQPFFSPDGRWVAFFTNDTQSALKKVALSGGNPITLASGINGSSWASGVWLDDGTIVFGATTSGLRRVSAEGGPVTELTSPDAARQESFHDFLALVPSARAVLFTAVVRVDGNSRIEAVTLDTGERRVVVDDAWGPLVIGDAYLLFHRQDTTLVAPFDGRSLTITGPAVPFAEDVRLDNPSSPWALAELTVSQSGTLAYLPVSDSSGTLGLVGRDGSFEAIGVPPGPIAWPRVAPDGHAVAFNEGRGPNSAVRIYDMTRGSFARRGQEDAIRGPAVWQAGTGSLAVSGRKGDAAGVFLDDQTGGEQLLVPNPPGAAPVRNIA